jgi:hypothetical protein
MKWFKPFEKLPEDTEDEVMIQTAENVHLAKFDGREMVFVLRNGKSIPVHDVIYWVELVRWSGSQV